MLGFIRRLFQKPSPAFISERQALIDAVYANPFDSTPRLALADWFDERDEPEKAALLRSEDWPLAIAEPLKGAGGRWYFYTVKMIGYYTDPSILPDETFNRLTGTRTPASVRYDSRESAMADLMRQSSTSPSST